MSKKKHVPLICEWCHEPFLGEMPTRRFCGRSCAMTSVHSTPEKREFARQQMLKMRARPDVQEKLHRHMHSESNPFRDPKTQRKAQVVLRAQGYPTLNGGNGRPLPIPQRLLAQRLGWATEYVVPTRGANAKLPNCLKIDIAEPALKIAIEVDGRSHECVTVKAKDQKKDQFLTEQGWQVLRFWNHEVLEDIDTVVETVMAAVKCST